MKKNKIIISIILLALCIQSESLLAMSEKSFEEDKEMYDYEKDNEMYDYEEGKQDSDYEKPKKMEDNSNFWEDFNHYKTVNNTPNEFNVEIKENSPTPKGDSPPPNMSNDTKIAAIIGVGVFAGGAAYVMYHARYYYEKFFGQPNDNVKKKNFHRLPTATTDMPNKTTNNQKTS